MYEPLRDGISCDAGVLPYRKLSKGAIDMSNAVPGTVCASSTPAGQAEGSAAQLMGRKLTRRILRRLYEAGGLI